MIKAAIEGDELVIRLPADILRSATNACPLLNLYCEEHNDFEPPLIVDLNTWCKEVVIELNREKEDGTTLVHEMFDKAFQNAAESGAEGIKFCGT